MLSVEWLVVKQRSLLMPRGSAGSEKSDQAGCCDITSWARGHEGLQGALPDASPSLITDAVVSVGTLHWGLGPGAG